MQFVEANGANIPAIGLGTWELRGRTCARIVEQALRLGYRHIDTAQVYENEREVGEGIRASRREARWRDLPHHQGLDHAFRAPRSGALRQGKPGAAAPDRGRPAVAALAESAGAAGGNARRAGAGPAAWALTRHIGVSNFTVALIEEAVAACPEPLVCDQVEYHPYLDQTKVRRGLRAQHGHGPGGLQPDRPGRRRGDEARCARSATRIGKTRGASLPALAGAAGRGGDPAHLEARAALEHRDLRLRAVRPRTCGRFPPWERRGRLTDFGFAPKWD